MSDDTGFVSLTDVLGFDPQVEEPISKQILGEVIQEVKKQRAQAARQRAKVKITELMKIQDDWAKEEEKFIKAKVSFEEASSRLLKSLEKELSTGEVENG